MHHSSSARPLATGALRSATLLIVLSGALCQLPAQAVPAPACDELARLAIGTVDAAAGDVCTITLTRTDISLTLKGTALPASSFRSRVIFLPADSLDLAIIELIVPESSMELVQRQLVAGGASLRATHPHMSGESPALVAVHAVIHAEGRAVAGLIRQVVGLPAGPPSGRSPGLMGEIGMIAGVPCVRLAMAFGAAEAAMTREAGFCRIEVPPEPGLLAVDGVSVEAGTVLPGVLNLRQTVDRTTAILAATLILPQAIAPEAVAGLVAGGYEVIGLNASVLGERPAMAELNIQATGNPLLLVEGLRAALEPVR